MGQVMRVDSLKARQDKDRYPRIEALISTAGLVIAIAAAGLAYVAYDSAHKDWQLKTTADIITEWNKTSPANTPHCFDFVSALDKDKLGLIVARQEMQYEKESEPDLLACVSDQTDDEINTFIKKANRILTPRGASFVGERVGSALGADSVVAALIVEGIGRSDILNDKIGEIMCRYDLKLLDTLHQVPKRENSYRSIMQFAKLPAPLGCH